jgi:hypothetical protein
VFGEAPFVVSAEEALRRWRFYAAVMGPRVLVRQRVHVEVFFDSHEPANEAAENALLVKAGEHGADLLIIARPPR